MIMDNVELKETTSETYGKDNRISSNKLKLRNASFQNVKTKWEKFLKRVLEEKLEEEKKKLVESEYKANKMGGFAKETEKEIEKTTAKIAKLEEIISFISKENLPKNYSKRRAIKLRKVMFEQLIMNSKGVYKVLATQKEEIFNKAKVQDERPKYAGYTTIDNFVYKPMNVDETPKEIDVQQVGNLTRNTIIEDVNKEFKEIMNETPAETHSNELGKEQIMAAVDSEYGKIYGVEKDINPVVDSVQIVPPMESIPNEVINKNEVEIPKVEVRQPIYENPVPTPVENNQTEEPIRDEVVVAESDRNQSRFHLLEKEVEKQLEKTEKQEEIVQQNEIGLENTSTGMENDEENDVLKEIENLETSKADYQASEERVSEITKEAEAAKAKAEEISRERAKKRAELEDLKKQLLDASASMREKENTNKRIVESTSKEIEQIKNKTQNDEFAINNYNSQIEKVTAALSTIKNSIGEKNSRFVKEETSSISPSTDVSDEAHKIVENPAMFTLSEMREVLKMLDNSTKSDIYSNKTNGVLDSTTGVMHNSTRSFGTVTSSENNSAFAYDAGMNWNQESGLYQHIESDATSRAR